MAALTAEARAERKALRREKRLERRRLRRSVKKDGNRAGWSLIWYFVITTAIVIVWMEAEIAIAAAGVSDPALREQIIQQATDISMESAWSMIAAVLIGLGFLFLFFRKQKLHRELFRRDESMSPGKFAGIACVFFGTQLIFNGFFYLIEAGLNLIGYSAISSMEAATAGSTTLSMFLYAGIIGPIVEELVFRGFILRALDRHGKPMAIVVSSVLFGIMHANIPQAVFAFFVGLVLGYVAERYSIWWSIILHILNNLVLGDLFSRAISGLGEEAQSIISFCVMGTFALVGVTLLILKRRDIIDYVKQHKGEKHRARWIATCSGVMIYFIINLALGIFMLEKI